MTSRFRGLLSQGVPRRYASIVNSIRSSARAHSMNIAPRPKPTPQSQTNASRPAAPQLRKTPSETHRAPHEGPQPQPNQHLRLLRRFLSHPWYRYIRRIVLLGLPLILAWLHKPYTLLDVTGTSMSPVLNASTPDGLPISERVFIKLWGPPTSSIDRDGSVASSKEGSVTELSRGQVVVYDSPMCPGRFVVKRIVAIPGDMVHPSPGYTGGDEPVIVPWNHVWVEGDAGARKDSVDSNWYGPISQNLIIGEVKAVLTSWTSWRWPDWREQTWPAKESGRIEKNAIMAATVDPDAVNYSNGWRDGSIAHVFDRIKTYPDQVLFAFVNNTNARQETRRLYNNALYVAEVANSDEEKQLAKDLIEEMESVYGREALVFGIRMKRQMRDRGVLPNADNSKLEGTTVKDPAASDAERWLKRQGWELERTSDGTVKTQSP